MKEKNRKRNMKKKELGPSRIIVLGFSIIILTGALLLTLPFASRSGESIGFLNALFTATSATCVTGLVVANTLAQWTLFGQLVIISLIQIGGLGFVTIVTLIFVIAGKKITLKEKLLLSESLNQNLYGTAAKVIKKIVTGTFIVEGTAAALLAIRFSTEYSIGKSLYLGVFHSISAFCNAGFDILSDSSLMPYVGDPVINIVIMLSIVIGGLGFTVWFEVIDAVKGIVKEKHSVKFCVKNLSLHSKLVLTVTPVLIFGGAIIFYAFEHSNPGTMGQLSGGEKIFASLFQSVTARTAGFNSIDQGGLTYGSKFLTSIVMMIGGSPASCAGGVKTVTVGVLVMTVYSVIQGRDHTCIYKRKVPFYIIQKTLAVTTLSFAVLCTVSMLLTVTERGMEIPYTFIDLFYEVASALATAGLTTGVTPYLSSIGKSLIIACMFFGRIGPITIALALAKRQANNTDTTEYAVEQVMVG